MQTFLPYSNFQKSAKCLDYRRLGKQRVEAKQILNALQGKNRGWRNHPATKMWKDYIPALKMYHNIMVTEWINRGYNNSMHFEKVSQPIVLPFWLGDMVFHASHRSNLLRKDSNFYGKFNWVEPLNLPYIWPVK